MGDKKSARMIAKEIVVRLFVTVFLWALLIVGFIYYPYSRPTMLPYARLAFSFSGTSTFRCFGVSSRLRGGLCRGLHNFEGNCGINVSHGL
jgi:hypothetical protein